MIPAYDINAPNKILSQRVGKGVRVSHFADHGFVNTQKSFNVERI